MDHLSKLVEDIYADENNDEEPVSDETETQETPTATSQPGGV